MTLLAPTLEAFFTQRLMTQLSASPHTIASYRDSWRLLLGYVHEQTGTGPSALDIADLDAPTIGAFLTHLEVDRGSAIRTRNLRLAAIHSLFRFAALHHPEHAASIQRVLAIPQKRYERTDITFLNRAEVDALLATWSTPKVNSDIHVKVGRALYSVPWAHIGKTVDARQGVHTVQIYLDGTLIKTHPRQERGRSSDHGDYPPGKIAFVMRTPAWCRHRAAELGPAVAELIADLMQINALYRLRSAQGVIGLAAKYDPARLDAACARAIAVGDPTYKTVKGILAAGTEHDGTPAQVPPAAPAHLHGPAQLFAVEAL